MEKAFEFSFDDEPVTKFCYGIREKRIEVHFTGYYELNKSDHFIDKNCVFVIENWKEGKSKIGDEKYYDLNKHIGIFSMILFMKFEGSDLEILVNTVDNRYVTLFFKEPNLSLR